MRSVRLRASAVPVGTDPMNHTRQARPNSIGCRAILVPYVCLGP
jgi:hypothetical protein